MLTGTWRGTYTLGIHYPPAMIGTTMAFEIVLTDDDGNLSGTCLDDGLPDNPARIAGFRDEEYVSFVKRYRYFLAGDNDGNILTDPEQTPHEVHYSGVLEGEKISGIFEFGEQKIFARAEEIFEGGTFTMSRLS